MTALDNITISKITNILYALHFVFTCQNSFVVFLLFKSHPVGIYPSQRCFCEIRGTQIAAFRQSICLGTTFWISLHIHMPLKLFFSKGHKAIDERERLNFNFVCGILWSKVKQRNQDNHSAQTFTPVFRQAVCVALCLIGDTFYHPGETSRLWVKTLSDNCPHWKYKNLLWFNDKRKQNKLL